jgi:hypothetical protein
VKIINCSNGWALEGMYLVTLPAYKAVEPEMMLAYYRMDRTHPHYDEFSRACKFDRMVIMKPSGDFVVVPVSEHIEVHA